MGSSRLARNAVDDSTFPIMQTLRLETVDLVLAAEISLLLVEGAGWRPDRLEGGVHNELCLWEVDLNFFIFFVQSIAEIDDKVVVQH